MSFLIKVILQLKTHGRSAFAKYKLSIYFNKQIQTASYESSLIFALKFIDHVEL